MDLTEEKLWVEKYRPTTIDDVILPKKLKKTFKSFIKEGDIPNLVLFSSSGGTGKTTTAKAICNDLNYDVMFINTSLEGNIDTLRSKMTAFVSSVSFTGNRKCIILDESDGANVTSFQPALRAFIERFSKNCRFIFTCNYVNKLLPQLLSRCTVIDFNCQEKADKKEMMMATLKRLFFILKKEGVKFNQQSVLNLLTEHYPDIRRCINELQRYSVGGVIDDGILVNAEKDNYDKLVQGLKARSFKDVREWVGKNQDISPEKIFRYFFDNGNKFMKPESIPQMILTTADYQYKAAFVVDQQINLTAYLTELMARCEFSVEEGIG